MKIIASTTIDITVDQTEYRITASADVDYWVWETEYQNEFGIWVKLSYGASGTRREALSEAMSVIEMN